MSRAWEGSLHEVLADFDGVRGTAALETLLAELPDDDAVDHRLIELCTAEEATVQAGASWLLRARLDAGTTLPPHLLRSLASQLPTVTDKWARQHLCQCLASLEVPADLADAFADFLRQAASAPEKFLRAWAVDGFVRLSQQHSHLTPEAAALLAQAHDDPAASVRARARRLDRELARRNR